MLTNEKTKLLIEGILGDEEIVGDFNYEDTSDTFKEFINSLVEEPTQRKSIPDMVFDTEENLIAINKGEVSKVYHMEDLTEVLVSVAVVMNIEPLLNNQTMEEGN